MRRFLSLLLLGLPLFAQEETQVDWAPDWEKAFAEAKRSERPVMVCINSKDGESASERAARTTYRDPEFVTASRAFVMIVVSTHGHVDRGYCPRFGRVTCKQHLDCWKELRARYGEQFLAAGSGGAMISPQHAWFRSDGTLLRRKEYELGKAQLLEHMRAVLAEVRGEPVPGGEENSHVDAPLDPKEEAELGRVQQGDADARRAAIGNLLATDKRAARVALVDLLSAAKRVPVRCDILRGLGRARVTETREAIEGCLKDRDALVRSYAAVALEELAQAESVPALVKRAKAERDTAARRNVYRALGACGGGAADKDAAKQLLRGLAGDRQNQVRKHCALALRSYEGPGAKLVLKKLEQTALKMKDRTVRGAIVYALAFIGNTKTTLPVLQQLLERQKDEYGKSFMRRAIRILRGEGGDFGRSAWWLFREDRDDPARS